MHEGQVVWVRFAGIGSAARGRRPAVVVQHERFNLSSLATVVVVAITSNLAHAPEPGNVRLRKGEANLPRASVVLVTQLHAVDRDQIEGAIGQLTSDRLTDIRTGVALVVGLRAPDPPPVAA